MGRRGAGGEDGRTQFLLAFERCDVGGYDKVFCGLAFVMYK